MNILNQNQTLYQGSLTRYVFVESPDVTPQQLVIRAYEVSQGVLIKETCFGLQITGSPSEVKTITDELRRIDPAHIFIKDRGFPPGDPRRCRANLGGARPGYYGHEFEMNLVRYVSKGLEGLYKGMSPDNKMLERIKHKEESLPAEKLIEIIKSEGA